MTSFQMPMLSMSLLGLCLLSGLDAPTAHADFTFGEPVNLGPTINSGAGDNHYSPCLSADGLELYFCRPEPGAQLDIFVARRATVDSEWGVPVNLGPTINTSSNEWTLSISADGLSLYFTYRSAPINCRLYVTKRATTQDNWGPPVSVGGAVSTVSAWAPNISADDLELYFASSGLGGHGKDDLWVTTRATVNGDWGAPVNLGPTINSPDMDGDPAISPDGLLLFFTSWGRPGAFSIYSDIYVARRTTKKAPWGPCMNLGPIINGTSGQRRAGKVSFDGSMLYLTSSGRPDNYSLADIWQAPIIPIVDFNGDGKVDGKDVLSMVARWGTDDPLCDVGPFAWGDGTVDLQDLTVLAKCLGKEVTDPALIAHWTLDETVGSAACESVSGSGDIVLGGALWQPAGGQVNGAIQLDGVDDCIVATFALDPAKGPFSVFAWVKGGAPGQVVISEPGFANWLMADAAGKLMTELKGPGRYDEPLLSQIIITDGRWHRVGLVWDGSRRMLYVDGVVAAEDTQDGLPSSGGGLYIGTGKAMEPGTFWSGLIDDVRIYNRAVKP